MVAYDRPEDIVDVGDACEFLGINMGSSAATINRTFEHIVDNTAGEQYWAAIKAREIALTGSASGGSTVYQVIRDGVKPADITSLHEAQELLNIAPPPGDSAEQQPYNRAVRSRTNTVTERLTQLAEDPSSDVTESNIRAVQVAHHALRFRDLTEGQQYVLGPDEGTET